MIGVGPVLAILLANDAMVGIAGGDQTADGRFGLAVGLGDRIEGPGAALVRLLTRAAKSPSGTGNGHPFDADRRRVGGGS